MRYAQRSFIGIGCLLGLLGACGNNSGGNDTGTTPTAGTTGNTAGTPTTPSGGSGGSTTKPPSGGTGAGGSTQQPTGGSTGTAGKSGGTAGGTAMGMAGGGATGAMCSAAGPAKTGQCKGMTDGVYAMKLDFDVWFEDAINNPKLLLPGRNTLSIYLKMNITGVCEDGSGGTAIVHPCGTILPPLYTDAVNKVIQIVFPDALWDQPGVPDFMTTGHVTGFDPGSMLVIDKTTSLVGISLADQEGAWPDYTMTPTLACADGKMGKDCFPDIDGDGKPGITAVMKLDGTPPSPGFLDGWQYTPTPTVETDALTGEGATEAYVGLRTRLAGSGVIGADCKSGVGGGEAEDFESRVFDCLTKAGAACTPDQSTFVDKNTPAFHVLKKGDVPPATWKYEGLNSEIDGKLNRMPSEGPKVASVRLAEGGASVTCADVRAAAFPTQ